MKYDDTVDFKVNCNSAEYFKLFEPYIPKLKLGSMVLLYAISNVDCLKNIIDKNQDCVYYIYDTTAIFDILKLINENNNVILVNDISEVNMKFDCIIMNPPYDGNKNLYGKITLEAKKHAKDVICLSPYLNYLETSQKKSNRELSNTLMKYLQSYKLVDTKTFDACFDKKLCIFHFTDNPETTIDINDIYWNEFKNPLLTKSIIKKMEKYANHCYSHIINKNEFDSFKLKVAFSGIRGHRYTGIPSWDWTTLLDEEKMVNFTLQSNSKGDLMGFPFKSTIECKHFVKYVMSDIFEYMILVQKNSMNTDKWLFKLIPYMPTYEHAWTDLEIAKEIGLTDEELNYIYEEMKPYGWKTRKNNGLQVF